MRRIDNRRRRRPEPMRFTVCDVARSAALRSDDAPTFLTFVVAYKLLVAHLRASVPVTPVKRGR